MQRFNMDKSKLQEVLELVWKSHPQFTSNKIEQFIDADWPNANEHQQWLNEAPASEIASWVEAGIE